jgi:hypothetical protein
MAYSGVQGIQKNTVFCNERIFFEQLQCFSLLQSSKFCKCNHKLTTLNTVL